MRNTIITHKHVAERVPWTLKKYLKNLKHLKHNQLWRIFTPQNCDKHELHNISHSYTLPYMILHESCCMHEKHYHTLFSCFWSTLMKESYENKKPERTLNCEEIRYGEKSPLWWKYSIEDNTRIYILLFQELLKQPTQYYQVR